MRKLRRNKRIWITLLLAALLLSGCGQSAPSPAAPTQTAEMPALSPVPTAAPAPTPASTPEPTPEPTPKPEPPSPTPGTDVTVPATQEPTRVDDSFFADAAFFGNSLMEGLHLFGGLKYGDFYSGTSASVVSVSTVKDFKDSQGESSTLLHALLEKQYKKIFVLFGINELGFHVNGFIDIYSELLDEIAAGEPDAQIFILSLTPITEKRSEDSDLFTKDRVEEFNRAVAAMAARRGCIYMDLYNALADGNGWLPEQDASDGIHFTGAKYVEWANFLRSYPYGAADPREQTQTE